MPPCRSGSTSGTSSASTGGGSGNVNRQRPFGSAHSWAQPLVADGPSGRPRFQRWEYQLAVPCICLALGVRNGLQVPLLHRRERRIRDELRGLLPDLLPTIPAHPCHPDPITWTSVQPIRITDLDLTVAFLSPGQGPPAGVLRVARTPRAACELRAHHEALTELSGDPRLAGWHHLLPDDILREDATSANSASSTTRTTARCCAP